MPKHPLKKADPGDTGKFKHEDDLHAEYKKYGDRLYYLLYLMFAHNRYSLLIILHGIDASGKDGTVRALFSNANPQGLRVFSFKQPTETELRHDFLWRCHKHTPESGYATVFNRSYYEEVTTLMVHPELLQKQHLPEASLNRKNFFEGRYQCINQFEEMLDAQGTVVVKFFLNISKDEQKKRLEDRLKDRSKNWKFSESDIQERKHWDEYMKVFNKMIHATSTKSSPWHIVPADHKWYRDYVVVKTLVDILENLDMRFPKPPTDLKKIKIK